MKKSENKVNINIVTVYQSANYGSFLQAYSLYSLISEKYPVYMVNAKIRNPLKNAVIPYIKRWIKGICRLNFKYAKFNRQMLINHFKKFRRIKETTINNADGIFIFGSDEIWNLSRKEMNRYPILWGEGINSIGNLAYAPSVNGCEKHLLQNGTFPENINKFIALSGRDEYTCQTLSQLTQHPVMKVLDPTMLYAKSDYIHDFSQTKHRHLHNYIAVYLFEVDENTITIVKEFAKKVGKKLISIGVWASWCDEVITDINPFAYYIDADYVITNTFHGTAFAINLGKQFVSFSRGKSKIRELLSDYNLLDRDASSVSDLQVIFDNLIDYSTIEKQIELNRKKSLDYLFGTLERIEHDSENH